MAPSLPNHPIHKITLPAPKKTTAPPKTHPVNKPPATPAPTERRRRRNSPGGGGGGTGY